MPWNVAPRFLVALALFIIAAPGGAQEDVPVFAGRGAVKVHVPVSYAEGHPTALLILLHGYSSDADRLEHYVRFTPLSDQKGFLLAFPNGLYDMRGNRYWNGTDVCCGPNTDDSGYLRDLIGVITTTFTVDSRRIFVFGHSNGGFMAHRMGCDAADLVAATVSLSAATWDDPSMCTPAAPVNVLEIHGTEDAGFLYDGGCVWRDACYPSAERTAQIWADLNHCTVQDTSQPPLDLTTEIDGPETSRTSYRSCDTGGSSGLWTMMGARHHPDLTRGFNDIVLRYLMAHPKPSDIPCDDVQDMQVSCDAGGMLGVELLLTSEAHDGKTVDFRIDGALRVAMVSGDHADMTLRGQAPGEHVVRLSQPQACAPDVAVTCE
jgi:polyhydroxybutyrate depolymerase